MSTGFSSACRSGVFLAGMKSGEQDFFTFLVAMFQKVMGEKGIGRILYMLTHVLVSIVATALAPAPLDVTTLRPLTLLLL